MTRDEQLIKAALDMAAMAAVTTPESRPGAPREWSDGFTSGCLHSADAIRAIPATEVLAKVSPAVVVKPLRLMAMCGYCREGGEEFCVQYLKDLRWDGAEWCCKDCFNASGENGNWDEAPIPSSQPADDLVDLRRQHADWSAKQFGDVSAVGPAKHLAKEALEVASAPSDPIEHADCWMLLWDMQRRAGISDAVLASAIREKLAINKARSWPAAKEGEAREHLPDHADAPAPDAVERLARQLEITLSDQDRIGIRTDGG